MSDVSEAPAGQSTSDADHLPRTSDKRASLSSATHRHHFAAITLLAVVVVGCYFSALHNDFVFDDKYQIVRNPMLRADGPWTDLLKTDVWAYQSDRKSGASNYYRPMQMLAYRFTEDVFGLRPAAFHAVNIVFHLLATFAAYLLVFQLGRKIDLAAAAALLFAVHPVHSEAVVWISALTELGCALFYFLALYCFIRGTAPEEMDEYRCGAEAGARRTGSCLWWTASLSLLFIALLWKEMALTFPAIIAFYGFFFATKDNLKRRFARAITLSLPFVGVVSVYVLLRIRVLGFFSTTYHWRLTARELASSAVYLLTEYWGKLTIPGGLNAFHVFHPVRSLHDPRFLTAVVVLTIVTGAALWTFPRHRLLSFAIAWTAVTLVPVLYVGGVSRNVFTERYMYIPSLGFCLILALGVVHLSTRPRVRHARAIAVLILAGVLAFYVVETLQRIPDWKDDYTFFATTVKASPDSAAMHNSFAQLLIDTDGDISAAEAEYRQAIEVAIAETPADIDEVANAYAGLSAVYSKRGQYGLALEIADQGLSYDKSVALSNSRAVALVHLGRMTEARETLLQTLQTRPNDEIALNWMGIVALRSDDYQDALSWFRKELVVLPMEAGIYNNVGNAYKGLGQYVEAQANFERAVELRPDSAPFRTNLAVVLAKRGLFTRSKDELRKALALEPGYQLASSALDRVQREEAATRQAPR